MPPDFTKKTAETLAKRAAYICSNPDCRITTAGPNSEPSSATVIGEAAHIRSARSGHLRYDFTMNDQSRSDISNGIWLCGNCHTQIDRDPGKFPADLLYIWRERHDEFVARRLGSQSDKVRFDLARHALSQFETYPPIIRRIAYDKSPAWEWTLTAALMRHLNAPTFRKLQDLREGVSTVQIEPLRDDEVLDWMSDRMDEMVEMVGPLANIINRFNSAWGVFGEPGDMDEIHHTARLLRDCLQQIVEHEVRLNSVRTSPTFDRALGYLQDALGTQIEKLRKVPDRLDEIVQIAISGEHEGTPENPKIIHETIEFTLPDDWSDSLNRELRLIKARGGGSDRLSSSASGCGGWLVLAVLLVSIFMWL